MKKLVIVICIVILAALLMAMIPNEDRDTRLQSTRGPLVIVPISYPAPVEPTEETYPGPVVTATGTPVDDPRWHK